MKFGVKIIISIVVLAVIAVVVVFLVGNSQVSALKERVDSAILRYDTLGQEVAFRELNKEAQDGDAEYVFVFTKIDSTLFVHSNPSRIGLKATTFVDESGYEYGKEIYEQVQNGEKIVKYRTINPQTQEEEQKVSYIIPHGDFYFGTGLYQK